MIEIAVIEDNEQMSNRLRNILSEWDYVSRTHTFSSIVAYKNSYKKLDISVILLDLDLNGESGISVLKLNKTLPKPAIPIIISSSINPNTVIEALSNGAIGYVYKSDPDMKIIECIKSSLIGESPISMQIASILIKNLKIDNDEKNRSDEESKIGLTARETEILKILAKGLSNKEISHTLGLSVHTINIHVRNIYKKLDASNRTEAVFEAKESGIL